MKILIQRVRQAGASNSRGALFFIITAVFVLGAAVPPTLSRSFASNGANRTVQRSSTSTIPTAVTPQIPATPPPCTTPPSGMISWWPAENDTHDIVSHNNGTWQSGGP